MTEEEWLACGRNTQKMQTALAGSRSDRKLRLFAVACCRRIERLLSAQGDRAVEVAERFADGKANQTELQAAWEAIHAEVTGFGRLDPGSSASAHHAATAAYWCAGAGSGIDNLASTAAYYAQCAAIEASESQAQAKVLVDIFGNPFHPVSFSAEWRTDTTLALARQMYEGREFSAMPILADALQDAGCEDETILGHCRDPRQVHVRGCWVVDLVLGKE